MAITAVKGKNETYKIDMCEGSILPKILRFTIPLILSRLLQCFFNTADILVVEHWCGDNAMAAVSSNGSLINLFLGLFIGLSIGTNVIAARNISGNHQKELSRTVHTSMFFAVVSGTLLAILGVCLSVPMLRLMSVPDSILPLSSLYLRIYFIGTPSVLIFNFGNAILNANGDTKRPMYYLTASGIANVLLNLIFVVFFDLGVAGVAIATVVSQTMSAFLIIRCLMKERDGMKFELSKLKFRKRIFIQIMRIGLPASFQSSLISLANITVQYSVNIFGETVIGGSAAAANIEGYIYNSMNSFYAACLSFTSQNFERRNMKRILRIQLTCQLLVMIFGISLSTASYLGGHQILRLFAESEEMIEVALIRMKYVTLPYFIIGCAEVLIGGLRGMGHSFLQMIFSIFSMCVLRIVFLVTIFNIPMFHNPETVFIVYPISWIVSFIMHLVYFIYTYRKECENISTAKIKAAV